MSYATIDDPAPTTITTEQIAVDLSLATNEGGWFDYSYNEAGDSLHVGIYNEVGVIVKTFEISMSIKEITE
ncbi:hypothetical protein [Leucobacter sp. M11]|uniref:hypothetical protein n=1 Tax=Leucobacter sp. M11 TaxID=2993565 RepID=UPI002D7FC6B9|nr:hypothetical protein [Leucobacter sp. M11]MEB4614021.1 hypothetical protein [Leucobacter sp. M11]